jgi:hypothetical protein
MEEIGMVYDTISDVAGFVIDVSDTLDTVKTICDAVEVALSAASAIPGAAAVTGPVISMYESIKPTLSTLIDLTEMVAGYLRKIIEILQTADQVCQGKFESLAGEALSSFASAA